MTQSLRTTIRRTIRAIRKYIRRRRPLRGSNLFSDLNSNLPHLVVRTVFDVGANVGDVSRSFVKHYQKCSIYAFEPIPSVYSILCDNVKHLDNVRCFNVALSDTAGRMSMRRQGHDGLYTLEESEVIGEVGDEVQGIQVTTIDEFCSDHDIQEIDYLKIDAGGHDAKVLAGCKQMLSNQAISIIEVEAGMNPDDQIFSTLEEMKLFLESFDYRVFALYEQMHEFKTKSPHLRRVNAVFISRNLIRQHTPE
ncbi:FkbM family methyltransferase [Bremerella cremea]|uniref:Methyltransferase FkbM domain-containing protein n=1 Tax=Blastopirellula marina TaxID=124 RepID=A0A2S8FCA0_9BACT|nr:MULTISPECIES: FkbM family methyltransferase [Pirellulaceae]PQO29777.1 hypothetical protein C5Y83_27430 [Blastopirellula marina]RCS43079.1 FkbM family methyltransferase [Bremerella cremea]